MARYTARGTSDSVNTCDCCGRTKLKQTVIMADSETGEVVHFGVICSARNSGLSRRQISTQMELHMEAQIAIARAEFRATPEFNAFTARMSLANESNITPGAPFREFLGSTPDAAADIQRIIAAKYSVPMWRLAN